MDLCEGPLVFAGNKEKDKQMIICMRRTSKISTTRLTCLSFAYQSPKVDDVVSSRPQTLSESFSLNIYESTSQSSHVLSLSYDFLYLGTYFIMPAKGEGRSPP